MMHDQHEMDLVTCTNCGRDEISIVMVSCRICEEGALCIECQKAGGICSTCEPSIDDLMLRAGVEPKPLIPLMTPRLEMEDGPMPEFSDNPKPLIKHFTKEELLTTVAKLARENEALSMAVEVAKRQIDALTARIAELESPAHKLAIVEEFTEQVERRAEDKMLKTGKLEGAHYAAMKQLRDEYREKVK